MVAKWFPNPHDRVRFSASVLRSGAVWKLGRLITSRSQVQILPPRPNRMPDREYTCQCEPLSVTSCRFIYDAPAKDADDAVTRSWGLEAGREDSPGHLPPQRRLATNVPPYASFVYWLG